MIDRRALLMTLAAGGLGLGLPRAALASVPGDRRFVFVILRGAMDGLAAVPPFGDRAYAARRGMLALDPQSCSRLDGYFALHPALAPLAPFWQRRQLAIVHAAWNGYRTRSHFDAQDLLEAGLGEKTAQSDGWLNRALAELRQGERRLGLAAGASIPLLLRGKVPVATWEPPGLRPVAGDLVATIGQLYANDPVLGPALADALKAQAFSTGVLGEDMKAGPQKLGPGGFRVLAEAAGKLLAAEEGPRIAALELGGWDTHSAEGTDKGRLAPVLAGLAGGLVALAAALGSAWDKTIVVAETEFGRTVAPNGTGGTDHGTASAMLLLGGALEGGRMVGDWPGLDQLEEGRDLRPANRSRGVLKGILRDHLGLDGAGLGRVFPDAKSVGPVAGIIRA